MDFSPDQEAAADAKAVVLCQPHNATGTVELAPALRLDGLSLIQRCPDAV
ncbi:hypothetical protein MycrhDRAFT_3575 [Mycolicibacterium rhodesiae JS60]|nr:hypothetical protein MycrhDRAFT_3575 [Mycolicibacterium rhodesiae JS60]